MQQHKIEFNERGFPHIPLEFKEFSKVCLLVDENTSEHCLPILDSWGWPEWPTIKIQSGEENKTLTTCEKIWSEMTNMELDRKSLLINLGGGVIGDMGGFCAATFKRGINFIQIPTTLLSQVDASVGGKLGIDFNGYKNHIGVFQNPQAVYVFPGFLKTLPQREVRSGFAEMLKHALIQDASAWDYIKKLNELDAEVLSKNIEHSINIKRKVVSADPKENGLRKILNFGHTIGHAVERFYLERGPKLLHGEAIAIGMMAEAALSAQLTGLPKNQYLEISDIIRKHFEIPEMDEGIIKEMVNFTIQDKKNKGSRVLMALLKEIGECSYDIPVDKEQMEESLKHILND